ncbi:MAG: helix-turn-helix transcriptional regulator [Pseudonocardia sp.]|nr:helix-turn-helix transcriptional regulator [Pseudonocardia sp.]
MPEPTPLSRKLGEELRALRTLAGLSQRALGSRIGLRQPAVHRIETGSALPTLDELGAWLSATTGNDDRREQLVPLLEAAHHPTRSWSDLLGEDRQLQDRARIREEQCSLIRVYTPAIVPGLLQTAEYARQLLNLVSPPGADVAAQIAKRLDRQHILYQDHRRFEFILGEQALLWSPGPEVMPAQLDRLVSLSTLSTVEPRVLPLGRVGTPPWHDFIYRQPADEEDQPYVTGELLHGEFTASRPDSVQRYTQLWDQLWRASEPVSDAVEAVRARPC